MEPNNTLDEFVILNSDGKPKIYSKGAILGFSIFFTPLAGAILLRQNLKDIGDRRNANSILIIGISLTVAILIIVNLITKPVPSLTTFLNILGALYFNDRFKKYFPADKDFEKKKIWKPLLIWIAIALFFLLAASIFIDFSKLL
jgi:ABC-type phosphate/phosphonate transport system permease subunit